MSNTPPTQKEKLLMRLLAKLYSQDTIQEKLSQSIEENGRSLVVEKAGKMFKIPEENLHRIGIQYLNYVNKNYHDIINGVFPDEFERTSYMTYTAEETITEIKYETQVVHVYGLESLESEIAEEVNHHFWEYEPDIVNTEYGDSETINFEFHGLGESHPYSRNVIY